MVFICFYTYRCDFSLTLLGIIVPRGSELQTKARREGEIQDKCKRAQVETIISLLSPNPDFYLFPGAINLLRSVCSEGDFPCSR